MPVHVDETLLVVEMGVTSLRIDLVRKARRLDLTVPVAALL